MNKRKFSLPLGVFIGLAIGAGVLAILVAGRSLRASSIAEQCVVAKERLGSVEVCMGSSNLCIYSPHDLYEGRQAYKYIAERCK